MTTPPPTIDAICDPCEIAVKSFFLGPNAENQAWIENELTGIFKSWFAWRQLKNSGDGSVISESDKHVAEFIAQQERTREVLKEVTRRFESEIPKFSPRYVGHMFSEISMPALLGHIITLLHNPNNISPEASKVGTQIEKEAIGALASLVGYPDGAGHFTSGGTVANFEFLFRARERLALWLAAGLASGQKNPAHASLMGWDRYESARSRLKHEDVERLNFLNHPFQVQRAIQTATGREFNGPVLFVPSSKHYSWPKAMHYLGLGEANIRYIELDQHGRASAASFKRLLDQALLNQEPILGAVAIGGTTELGSIDPIDEFAAITENLESREGLHLWLHVDAAYGGFFRTLVHRHALSGGDLATKAADALDAIKRSTSVTLDPHKLGYVPYSSGAFLCREPRDHFIRGFTGAYIVSDNQTLGNFTLEGSRSAAGAVATYASLKSFESVQGYARVLSRTLLAKREFEIQLARLPLKVFVPDGLDTNVLCFTPLGATTSLHELNERTSRIYNQIQATGEYWISKTTLTKKSYGRLLDDFCGTYKISGDSDQLTLLRLTLMNPFIISKENKVDHTTAFCRLLEKEFTKANG